LAGHWTQQFSFVTGTVRSAARAYLARVADDLAEQMVEHTFISEWDNGIWRGADIDMLPWTTVGASVCQHPTEQGIFLGLKGEIFCIGSGNIHEERIRLGEEDSPQNRGMMRGIRSINGKAYAVGMRRQVYRRDDVNQWTCLDETARPREGDRAVVSFEAIDGFAVNDIYAAGRRGEIWRYDGNLWSSVDSPTNIILTNICCAGDDNVYVCGRLGTLVRGRNNVWQMVEHESTEEDFWGIAWYNDKLYLSTMRTVYQLEGDQLEVIDFREDIPSSCFHLSTADGVLWSIGSKDVMAFDGQNWTRID
jgi:hypothetical protein